MKASTISGDKSKGSNLIYGWTAEDSGDTEIWRFKNARSFSTQEISNGRSTRQRRGFKGDPTKDRMTSRTSLVGVDAQDIVTRYSSENQNALGRKTEADSLSSVTDLQDGSLERRSFSSYTVGVDTLHSSNLIPTASGHEMIGLHSNGNMII